MYTGPFLVTTSTEDIAAEGATDGQMAPPWQRNMWEHEALSSYKIVYFVFVILYELPENWNISYTSLPLHSGRKNTMQVFGFFRNTNVRQEGPWGGKLTPGKIYFFQF